MPSCKLCWNHSVPVSPFPKAPEPSLLLCFACQESKKRVAHGRGQRCTWPRTTLHTATDNVVHGRVQRFTQIPRTNMWLGVTVKCMVVTSVSRWRTSLLVSIIFSEYHALPPHIQGSTYHVARNVWRVARQRAILATAHRYMASLLSACCPFGACLERLHSHIYPKIIHRDFGLSRKKHRFGQKPIDFRPNLW